MARHPEPRLLTLGDQCLVVEFGEGIDLAVNRRACGFAGQLRARQWPFVVDVVPSFTSVGIHYRIDALDLRDERVPSAQVEAAVREVLAEPEQSDTESARLVEIPVCYGDAFGPDLLELAAHNGLTQQEMVRRHGATTGHVFMIGFAPGLPYIGLWDESFALPRRSTPRTHIPAGTVAIANRQTIIYPFELPGGWNLVGRTPLRLFDADREQPCLLEPGDRVRFVAIDAERFAQWMENGQ